MLIVSNVRFGSQYEGEDQNVDVEVLDEERSHLDDA